VAEVDRKHSVSAADTSWPPEADQPPFGGATSYENFPLNVTTAQSPLQSDMFPNRTSSNNDTLAVPSRRTRHSGANVTNESDQLHRAPLSTIFPASKQSVKRPLISQEKFHWDQVSNLTAVTICEIDYKP